jgi:hypothetical protein
VSLAGTLLPDALADQWVTPSDADRFLSLHDLRRQAGEPREISAQGLEAALEFCIELIDKHW